MLLISWIYSCGRGYSGAWFRVLSSVKTPGRLSDHTGHLNIFKRWNWMVCVTMACFTPSLWFAMIVKGLVITLTLQCSANAAAPFAQTGEPRAICPNPTIKVVEGDDVRLPCYLDPPHDVVKNTVDWKEAYTNKVVYSYRHEKKNDRAQSNKYNGRATMNHEVLNTGDLTLQISPVQLSDNGSYRCFVSRLMASCTTQLFVVTRGQQDRTKGNASSTTKPPLDEPPTPGGANKKLLIVFPIILGVFLIVVLVLIWKYGILQTCVARLRGQGNGAELQTPLQQGGTAANGVGNNQQVV